MIAFMGSCIIVVVFILLLPVMIPIALVVLYWGLILSFVASVLFGITWMLVNLT